MFIAENWINGHPDDTHDDGGEGFTVDWVSHDAATLVGKCTVELALRFTGEEAEYQVQTEDEMFLVQMRYADETEWTTYFIVRPIEVI